MKKILAGFTALSIAVSIGNFCVFAQNNLAVDSVYATINAVYVNFDAPCDFNYETAKNNITLTDKNGNNVNTDVKIYNDCVMLMPEEKLIPEQVYTVSTDMGLTCTATEKTFMINKIYAPDLTKDNSLIENYFNLYDENGGKATVRNGKIYMDMENYSSLTLKEGIIDGDENYSINFDLELYNSSDISVLFNKTNSNTKNIYNSAKFIDKNTVIGGWRVLEGETIKYYAARNTSSKITGDSRIDSEKYKTMTQYSPYVSEKIVNIGETNGDVDDTADGVKNSISIDKLGFCGYLFADGSYID